MAASVMAWSGKILPHSPAGPVQTAVVHHYHFHLPRRSAAVGEFCLQGRPEAGLLFEGGDDDGEVGLWSHVCGQQATLVPLTRRGG
jgi:hypothetical protein